MSEVRQVFRPEFLNRVDEIIVFHALTNEEIRSIARLLVSQVIKRLSESAELSADGRFRHPPHRRSGLKCCRRS